MYLTDFAIGANTRLGELNLLLRQRFNSRDYEAGRTAVLNAATPSLNLGEIARMKVSIKGTAAIAYQDRFVSTSSEWGYANYGLSLSFKGKNISIDAFGKKQETLRSDLKDYIYGGIKVTYVIQ
jgi:hypothetical protein